MTRLDPVVIVLTLIALGPAAAAIPGDVVAPGAELQRVADVFKFTEGPAADAAGNVYFTDQPNNRIWKWSADSGILSVFHEEPGRANGLWVDHTGAILACADLNNELWAIDPQGRVRVLVRAYGGKKLNGPNDLWEDPQGGIYFTDPLYKRPYWSRGPMEQDGEHVYYLAPDRRTLSRVLTDLVKPNGIVGTPDGRRLYVADIGDKKTYVYEIQGPGRLGSRHLAAPLGSDGMTLDARGNLYLTGKGVSVFNDQAQQIRHIDVPSRWTANVCFAGRDRDILFITASESVYTLKMAVRGAQ